MTLAADLPAPGAAAPRRGGDAWVLLRCLVLYVPAMLVLLAMFVAFIIAGPLAIAIIGALVGAWTGLRRLYQALRTRSERLRAEQLTVAAFAAVAAVTSGCDSLADAIEKLIASDDGTAARLVAPRVAQEAATQLAEGLPAAAYVLACIALALGDAQLPDDERLACRRILLGVWRPTGPLASDCEAVVNRLVVEDRRTAPDLWARISWWHAEQLSAAQPLAPATAARVRRIYSAVASELAHHHCDDLRAEALRRLARAHWDSRATALRPMLCEEQAICCARRAIALLADSKTPFVGLQALLRYYEQTAESAIPRAEISHQLGVYWYHRQAGDRAQNLEEAITCLAAAAEVQRLSGGDFALTQHWLGAAFLDRVRGDHVRNLERAIACFQQAHHLEVPDEIKQRTRELADRAVQELWGRAAGLASVPASPPDSGAHTAVLDLASLVPAAAAGEPASPGRARQLKRYWPLAALAVCIVFFRHPLIWVTTPFVALGIAISQLAADYPRGMEEYCQFLFLALPRFGVEPIRAWRTFKASRGRMLDFFLSVSTFLAEPRLMLPELRRAVEALDERRFPLLRLLALFLYGHLLQANPVGEVGESCEEVILQLRSYRGAVHRRSFALLERFIAMTLADAYLRRPRGDRADNARCALVLLREEVVPALDFRDAGFEGSLWLERKRTLYLLGEAHRRLAATASDDAERRRAIDQAVDCFARAVACKRPPPDSLYGLLRENRARLARRACEGSDNELFVRAGLGRGLEKDDWESFSMDAEALTGLADLWRERGLGLDQAVVDQQRSLLESARALVAQAADVAAERTGFTFTGIARQRIEIDLRLARLERRAAGGESCASGEALYRQAAGAAMREGASALVVEALAGLGELLYRRRDDAAAIDVLFALMSYQDRIRWQVMSIGRRAELLRGSIEDFDRLINALFRQERYDEAVALAERSRSRTLIDLLQLRGVLPRQPATSSRQHLRDDIVRLTLLETQAGEDSARYALMRHLRDDDLAPLEQEAELVAGAQPLTLTAMKALAHTASATFLLLRVTAERSFAFLVFPDDQLEAVETPRFTSSDLDRIVDVMERKGESDAWPTALDGILAELSNNLLGPVRERLRAWQRPMDGTPRLVIVPNRGLAVVPLHACFWDAGGRRTYLIDEYLVSYAPNLSVLARCLEREAGRRDQPSLFAVGNTLPITAPLPAAESECESIERATAWESAQVRLRDAATRAEVLEHAPAFSCVHFACHASYLTNDPFSSHLALAGGTNLTLGEIVEQLALPRAWLVALSACETGRLDSHEVADESLGLATGFLIAGAPTVWCTLWKVGDAPTALLMAKAYQILFVTGKPKCEALREAQLWLRDLTQAEVKPLIATLRSRDLHSSGETETWTGAHPFVHPASWAAYQSVGA